MKKTPNVESRKAGFKFQGMTTEELRRRREENQVEIRKAKREDSLNKRRNIVEVNFNPDATASILASEATDAAQGNVPTSGLFSSDPQRQLQAVTDFRKLLSKEERPPIEQVIRCGVLPRFVEMLGGTSAAAGTTPAIVEQIQFEAAWVLTNVASGNSEQTAAVVRSGAVPLFVQLLDHSSEDIREQCVWALGNIAGDSPECRDFLLNGDILSPLVKIMNQELETGIHRPALLRNGAWTISNLCRGKPSPSWNQVAPVLPFLSRLLVVPDDEVLADTAWALSYLSDGPNESIADVISSGVVPRLIALLSHRSHSVQTPALRALGNIVTGDDLQTQSVIEHGVLPAFAALLQSTRPSILKETCWAISNITAGTPEQIQAVIDANIIPLLVQFLAYGDFKTKKEACWAICNATSAHKQHPMQVKYLVSQGCIKPLCDLLNCQDNRIITVALDGLENILSVGEQEALSSDDNQNPFALYVEEAQGLDTIYNLQHHGNNTIYIKAKEIIDKYFGSEEEELDFSINKDGSGEFLFNSQHPSVPNGGFDFSN